MKLFYLERKIHLDGRIIIRHWTGSKWVRANPDVEIKSWKFKRGAERAIKLGGHTEIYGNQLSIKQQA